MTSGGSGVRQGCRLSPVLVLLPAAPTIDVFSTTIPPQDLMATFADDLVRAHNAIHEGFSPAATRGLVRRDVRFCLVRVPRLGGQPSGGPQPDATAFCLAARAVGVDQVCLVWSSLRVFAQ